MTKWQVVATPTGIVFRRRKLNIARAIRHPAGLIAYWPTQESVDSDIAFDRSSSSLAYPGPELLANNGSMLLVNWTAGNNATLSNPTSDVLRIARNGTNDPHALQTVITSGDHIVYHVEARSDGFATPRFFSGSFIVDGTTSTDWQVFDGEFVADNTLWVLRALTNIGTQYVEYRNVSIRKANPLNGDNANVTTGQTAIRQLGKAYLFNGANSELDIYSLALNSALNRTKGTMLLFGKVSSAGIWTNGLTAELMLLFIDNNNFLLLRKDAGNNSLSAEIRGSGVAGKSIATTTSTLDYFLLAVTWNSGTVKMYLNDTLIGTTTGGGAVTGNLSSSQSLIGANTSGVFVWDGLLTQAALYTEDLTVAQIAAISKAGGTS